MCEELSGHPLRMKSTPKLSMIQLRQLIGYYGTWKSAREEIGI